MRKSRREDMGSFSSSASSETYCLSYSAIPGVCSFLGQLYWSEPQVKRTDKQRETTEIQFTAVSGLLNSQATLKPGGFVTLLALTGKNQAEMLLSGQGPGWGKAGKAGGICQHATESPEGLFLIHETCNVFYCV